MQPQSGAPHAAILHQRVEEPDQIQVERSYVHHIRPIMNRAHFKLVGVSLPSGRRGADVLVHANGIRTAPRVLDGPTRSGGFRDARLERNEPWITAKR